MTTFNGILVIGTFKTFVHEVVATGFLYLYPLHHASVFRYVPSAVYVSK